MENNEEMEKFIKKLENQLKSAYRKYKNHVYYDNYSAIQRFDLAKFEVENFKISFVDKAEYEHNKDFEKAFDDYFSKLAYDLTNDWCNKIKNIIDNIDVISFPKNVESVNDKKNNIITNFKKSSSNVSKIHYFIDLPVEGHILGVLWILRLGYVLDDKLYKHCYGNRLNEYLLENLKETDNSEEYDFSPFLFQPYYKKYQSWRDDGLDVADNLLKNKKNAIILSLDFKDYYYRSLIDFKDLFEDIKDTQEKLNIQYDEIEEEFNNNLNNFIKEVFEIYSSKFNRKITNEALYPNENLNNKKCLATLAETLVASSLYKLKLLRHNFIGLFYDPKKSGVDFLVRNIDKIIPIEVGVGKKTKSQLTKAINNYNSDYGILISNRTFSIKKENNIIYIPLRTFSYI